MKTAVVIGGTGMVGLQLIDLLIADNRFDKVIVFGRRSTGRQDAKLNEHMINFDEPAEWESLVHGDILFSSLGTTLKQAGGQKAQYRIDHTYQYTFAKTAAQNGIGTYVLVSSAGANPGAAFFYPRMKGELERDIKKLPFASTNIIQPGLLVGERKEERLGEKLGFKILTALNAAGIFKSYRPVHGRIVAQAMINAGIVATPGTHTFKLNQVFELAASNSHG